MKWKNSFSVNIDEFDNYNKDIIKYFNRTVDLILKNEERKKITTALMNVLERMRACFKTEERYMTRFKYPEYEEHSKKHKRIVKRIVYIRKLFSDEEKKIDDDSFDYFKKWLENHIMNENKKFAPYFRLHKKLRDI